MRKLAKKRWGLALLLILLSGVASAILGGLLFGGFTSGRNGSSFLERFWFMTKAFYLMFFAGGTVSGLLLLLTKVDDKYALHFGYGLYYGTLGLSLALQSFFSLAETAATVLGFILAGLICLVIWFAVVKPYFTHN